MNDEMTHWTQMYYKEIKNGATQVQAGCYANTALTAYRNAAKPPKDPTSIESVIFLLGVLVASLCWIIGFAWLGKLG